jgi:hypothetical protein
MTDLDRLIRRLWMLSRQAQESVVSAETAKAAFDESADALERMKAALEGMLRLYTGLVNSGGAGFWDPEEEPEVIAARRALKTWE